MRRTTIAALAGAAGIAGMAAGPLAQAAQTALVSITDGGHKAKVTAAGQLLSAPAAPAASRFYRIEIGAVVARKGTARVVVSPPCGSMRAPTTAGLVVTRVLVDHYNVTSPGSGTNVSLHTGNACSPNAAVAFVNPAGVGETVLDLSPGFVVPAGKYLSFATPGVAVSITVVGYTVPKAAATAYSPVSAPIVLRQKR